MSDSSATDPMLAHMVYFTLKDKSSASMQKMLQDCQHFLSGHPGTVLFAVGTLTPDLSREVNDRGFDIALQLVFKDRTAHDLYQVADRHLQFIAANKENWEKVRVFDADVR